MITETLLRSHDGVIRVFARWPMDRDAAFSGLVAEGDVRVSAAIASGRVTFVRLERGPNCGRASVQLESPWTGAVVHCDLPAEGCARLTP